MASQVGVGIMGSMTNECPACAAQATLISEQTDSQVPMTPGSAALKMHFFKCKQCRHTWVERGAQAKKWPLLTDKS